jgi:hypothetical protein
MTYEKLGQPALDYFPCRYGTSKMLFRGPRRRLHGDYVTFLGGIDTYGRFIETPYPALVELGTGIRSVNLGCVNAGVDAYLVDKSLVGICARSRVTVVQAMGAHNMSNRFYAVHPRRNDRFLRASPLLRTIFPEVDFTEFSFTRHMLGTLAQTAPEKFSMVRQELKDAWVGRMNTLTQQIDGKVVLLWLADHAPGPAGGGGMTDKDPLFVDRGMIDAVSGSVSEVVEIVATPDEIAGGLHEMIHAPLEQPAAEELMGPVVHRRVAEALSPVLQALV